MRISLNEMKRWLRALEIAKILFEDQGYHSVFLEEIENFIKREIILNGGGEIELKKDSPECKEFELSEKNVRDLKPS